MKRLLPILCLVSACSSGLSSHRSAPAAADPTAPQAEVPLSLQLKATGLGLTDAATDYSLTVNCRFFGAPWIKVYTAQQLNDGSAKLPQAATACYAYLSDLQVNPNTATTWHFKPQIATTDADLFNKYQQGASETYNLASPTAANTVTAQLTLTAPFTVAATGATVAFKFNVADAATAATALETDVVLPPPVIKFGLLFNNMQCGMCHLDVHGSIVSVSDVLPMRDDSVGHVYGQWLVNGSYHPGVATAAGAITVDGGVTSNYNNSGKELPVDSTGKPAFPALDFTKLATQMRGTLTAPAAGSSVASIAKVYQGNTVLIGTAANPIVIHQDILVQGDLIIKGVYQGVGTIYATGNIYIPANLTGMHAPNFPYSDTAATADAQAASDLAANADALGIASGSNIFLGDIENYDGTFGAPWNPVRTGPGPGGIKHQGIYEDNNNNQPRFFSVNTGMYNLYNWKPEAQFQLYYETVPTCSTYGVVANSGNEGKRSFNRIDAVLYSKNAIGGVTRGTAYRINGGVIALDLHIISDSATGTCGNSAINYDARLRNGGLQILQQLAPFFPQSVPALPSAP